MSKLIHCIECNTICNITPFDQSPKFNDTGTPDKYHEIEMNDFADFLRKHRGHRKETLSILENSLYSEGAYSDPMRITYLEATNGRETFLMKRWRNSIDEDLRYDLIQGKLEVTRTVEIQKSDLQRQISHEIRNPSLSPAMVAKFLDIVQEEAASLDPEQYADVMYESNDARLSYLPLNDKQISTILIKCRNIFTPEEIEKISQFIRNNCDYDSVMSLVVKMHGVIHSLPLSSAADHNDNLKVMHNIVP